MKINIIFALENTCNVLCNSIIRSWKIMRYTRFIIMRSRVQSPVPLQKKHFGFLQNAFFVFVRLSVNFPLLSLCFSEDSVDESGSAVCLCFEIPNCFLFVPASFESWSSWWNQEKMRSVFGYFLFMLLCQIDKMIIMRVENRVYAPKLGAAWFWTILKSCFYV